MRERLLLLGTAREASTRVKDKMIRDFCGSSLYEIYLKRLETIKDSMFHVVMAICPDDTKLWEMSKGHNVETIERSKGSVSQGIKSRAEELHFLDKFDEEYVMWVNGCLPFLKNKTIVDAARLFRGDGEIISMTTVKVCHNWFWDEECRPLNNKDPKCVSTQMCPIVYESTHAFHIFNRKQMLEKGIYWGYNGQCDPYLWVMTDKKEVMDIDSEEDFRLCEKTWMEQNHG